MPSNTAAPPWPAAPSVGVVIPYYQRQPGILARALRSIAAQASTPGGLQVLVVDDASPHPPEPELASVPGLSCRVIKQANGGPGAARNTALDALPAVDAVAFLDSDDAWEPEHLACALQALGRGFDFYAAPLAGDERSATTLAEIYGEPVPLRPQAWADWALALEAPMLEYTVRGPFATSSTMVMRRSLIGDIRFDPRLRTAGEDGLFKTMLAARAPRVCVSTRIGGRSGPGVHVFTEGDWGSAKALERACDHALSRRLMRPLVQGQPRAQAHLRQAQAQAQRAVLQATLAYLRRHGLRGLPAAALWQLLRPLPARPGPG